MAQQIPQIGQYSLFLEETDSTNSALKLWLERESLPEGAMVYTHYQTAGRGQENSHWESLPGQNLLLSILLYPSFLNIDEQVWLNLCACLAVQKTVKELSGQTTFIKWPNDIFVDHHKIAGILIENVLQGTKIKYSIVGVGLNLNQMQFSFPQASSVKNVSGLNQDLAEARAVLGKHFTETYRMLKGKQWSYFWDTYHANLYAKGQLALFEAKGKQFEGEVMGIDKKGRLHIYTNDEVRSFANKEVKLIHLI